MFKTVNVSVFEEDLVNGIIRADKEAVVLRNRAPHFDRVAGPKLRSVEDSVDLEAVLGKGVRKVETEAPDVPEAEAAGPPTPPAAAAAAATGSSPVAEWRSPPRARRPNR